MKSVIFLREFPNPKRERVQKQSAIRVVTLKELLGMDRSENEISSVAKPALAGSASPTRTTGDSK
jgi:hypothetical protein